MLSRRTVEEVQARGRKLPSGRAYHTFTAFDTRCVVIGGRNPATVGTLFSAVPPMLGNHLHLICCCVYLHGLASGVARIWIADGWIPASPVHYTAGRIGWILSCPQYRWQAPAIYLYCICDVS